jgi:hypothetical protein
MEKSWQILIFAIAVCAALSNVWWGIVINRLAREIDSLRLQVVVLEVGQSATDADPADTVH